MGSGSVDADSGVAGCGGGCIAAVVVVAGDAFPAAAADGGTVVVVVAVAYCAVHCVDEEKQQQQPLLYSDGYSSLRRKLSLCPHSLWEYFGHCWSHHRRVQWATTDGDDHRY